MTVKKGGKHPRLAALWDGLCFAAVIHGLLGLMVGIMGTVTGLIAHPEVRYFGAGCLFIFGGVVLSQVLAELWQGIMEKFK